jgi:hypothetical protein
MFTGEIDVENKKYKNIDQTNKDLADVIDYSSSLDFKPSATRIGIYMNISDHNLNAIDTTFSIIKKKLCRDNSIPELFIHRQYNRDIHQFIRIIATGMELPTDEVKDMYNKYQNSASLINNKKENFFDSLKDMDTKQINQTMFNDKINKASDFFDQMKKQDNSENKDTDETSAVIKRARRNRKLVTTNNTLSNEYTIETDTSRTVKTSLSNSNTKKSFVAGKHNSNKEEYSEDNISKNY